MSSCSAPGKMILLGEHAVVFGKPAVAVAIDLRMKATLEASDQFTVNGRQMSKKHHSYISAAMDQAWDGPPVKIATTSNIPSGSGLGSSAAVTVASVASMLAERGKLDLETVARKSFEVELAVQGRASPIDTSTSTNGKGVLVSPESMDGLLWRIERAGKVWNVHHCEVPKMTVVVGFTGIRAATGPLVAKVKKLAESSSDAQRAIDRIGEIVLDGIDALGKGDLSRFGGLMSENQDMLRVLGVSHPSLERLIEACSSRCYGTKLTGAGGGGSMIALTSEPDVVAGLIRNAGGQPLIVRAGCEGVRCE